MASFSLLCLPILVFGTQVVFFSPTSTSQPSRSELLSAHYGKEGPRLFSKISLSIALFLMISSNFLPLNIISRLFHDNFEQYGKCLDIAGMQLFSVVDLMNLGNLIAMVFTFMFVTTEFSRVKERCVWYTVRQVTDTFGFYSSSASSLSISSDW